MTLNLYPSPILFTRPCDKVEVFGDHLLQITEQMTALLYMYKGSGIAAPQCGLNAQIAIIDMGEKEGSLVLVNPSWNSTPTSTEIKSNEGCLSIPGIEAKNIPRQSSINVTWQDLTGDIQEKVFEGQVARAIQHEFDHLMGFTIFDKVGPVQRKLLLTKYSKIQKKIKLYNQFQEKMKK